MGASARSGSARILIASADAVLSQSRKQIIEQAGWEVVITRNKQHALAILHNEEFDIMLICNSLSQRTRAEFATMFRQRKPAGKIMVVEGRDQRGVEHDLVLSMPVTPSDLLASIRTLLKRRAPAEADD